MLCLMPFLTSIIPLCPNYCIESARLVVFLLILKLYSAIKLKSETARIIKEANSKQLLYLLAVKRIITSGMRKPNIQQWANHFWHIYRRKFYILRAQRALCLAPMDRLFFCVHNVGTFHPFIGHKRPLGKIEV